MREQLESLPQGPKLPPEDWFVPWSSQLREGGTARWKVVVDPGKTWADLPKCYTQEYRSLSPQAIPPLAFQIWVRADSALEALAFCQLIEPAPEKGLGAQPGFCNPILMGFERHHLADFRGRPIGPHYRSALQGKHQDCAWTLWPQLHVLLADGLYRPDGLLRIQRGRLCRWAWVQIDGGIHSGSDYDVRLDAKFNMPTLRFSKSTVLGMEFARHFRERWDQLFEL
jgi:hypothetical protein